MLNYMSSFLKILVGMLSSVKFLTILKNIVLVFGCLSALIYAFHIVKFHNINLKIK